MSTCGPCGYNVKRYEHSDVYCGGIDIVHSNVLGDMQLGYLRDMLHVDTCNLTGS
jgi:hypothetical protein